MSSLVIASNHTPVGEWRFWYPSGQLTKRLDWGDGNREGLAIDWFENGQKRSEGSFVANKRHGVWTFWNRDGSVRESRSGVYRDGKLVEPRADDARRR